MAARAAGGPWAACGVENAADHNFCKSCGPPLSLAEAGAAPNLNSAERRRDRCLEPLKANPDNPRAHFDPGLASSPLGQTGNAARAFERCLQLEDAYPAAHFQLSLCHYRRGAMSECAAAAR